MPDFDEIMKMAQEAQAKLMKAQEELDKIEVEGVSGGGLVRIRATAKGRIISVDIDESLLAPAEKQMVEDLVAAAINDARAKADAGRRRGEMREDDRRPPAPARLQDAVLTRQGTVTPAKAGTDERGRWSRGRKRLREPRSRLFMGPGLRRDDAVCS